MKKIFSALLVLFTLAANAETALVPDCWSNYAHRSIKQGSYLLNFRTSMLSEEILKELLVKVEHINHMSASQPYQSLCQDGSMCVTVRLMPSDVPRNATIRNEVEDALGQIASNSGVSIDCVARPR